MVKSNYIVNIQFHWNSIYFSIINTNKAIYRFNSFCQYFESEIVKFIIIEIHRQ